MSFPAPSPGRQKSQISPISIAQTYYIDQSQASEDSLAFQLHRTDDLRSLPDHSEMAILATLRSRLQLGIPFTSVGPLLLSVKSDLDPTLYFNESVKSTYTADGRDEDLPPHLYTASLEAYNRLRTTGQSQAIVLLGHTGSGKTFNLIHLLDHLVTLSTTDSISREVESDKTLFKLLHSGIQALHIMGSVMGESNLESTCCGLVVEVKFDAKFQAVGGAIRAKLLDVSLPHPRNGRTYQVLHSLLCANKPLLQSLGLHSSVPFRIFEGSRQTNLQVLDSEAWLRFVNCLNQLSLGKPEYQSFLDLLACVIHLFDVPFVSTNFIPRSSVVPCSHWVPRNRSVIQKVCRLLGCSEDKFMEVFSCTGSKEEAENRLFDLARSLFEVAFQWLLEKVNEYLEIHCQSMVEVRTEAALSESAEIRQERKALKRSFQPLSSISLVDFPGFSTEGTIGTLSKNLALETLNLYCSSPYVTLLSALGTEDLRFAHMDVPRCKEIVDLFLGKETALAASIGLPNLDFSSYWKDLKTKIPASPVIDFTAEDDFSLQYTWMKVSFRLSALRRNLAEQFGPHLNALFFKKCTNSLLTARSSRTPSKETAVSQGKIASGNCQFGDKMSMALTYLMKPLLSINPIIIYCLHSIKNEDEEPDFPLHTTVSLFRNSLLLPKLLWDWFGFPIWESKGKLLHSLLGEKDRNSPNLKRLLEEILGERNFLMTERSVLMRNGAKEILEKRKKEVGTAGKLFPEEENGVWSQIPHREDLFPHGNSETDVFVGADLNGYMTLPVTFDLSEFQSLNLMEDSDLLVQELPKNKHFRRLEKRPSSLNSTQSHTNVITLTSRHDFAAISKTLRTPEFIDYTDLLPYIIRIQRNIRGFLTRKYTAVLLSFARKAVVIQSFWRGEQTRRVFRIMKKEENAAKTIQRTYRRHRGRLIRAAIKIQRWYLSILTKRYMSIRRTKKPVWTSKAKSSISPARQQYSMSLHTGVRSSLRSSTSKASAQKDEYTFAPNISKHSLQLAETRHSRLGSDHLAFPDRFRVMENERQRKLHLLVQQKLEKEGENLTLTPKVNKRSGFPTSKSGFYERQMEKWIKLKRWKDVEMMKKDAIESEELTFVPKVIVSGKPRSIDKTIEDLYVSPKQTWDRLRDKELKKKREESHLSELSELWEKVSLSPVSEKIAKGRRQRESETEKTLSELASKSIPYWPSDSPNPRG